MSFLGIAKTPVEVPYDGKVYELSPLGFKELGKFILWYKWKEFEEAKELVQGLDKDLANEILKERYEFCKNKKYKYFATPQDEIDNKYSESELSWENPEIQLASSSVEGIGKQLELSLKIKHPEISPEICSKIVHIGNYNDILEKLYEVSGVKKDTEGEQNPNQ